MTKQCRGCRGIITGDYVVRNNPQRKTYYHNNCYRKRLRQKLMAIRKEYGNREEISEEYLSQVLTTAIQNKIIIQH